MATSNLITGISAGVGAAASATLRPAVGIEWLVTDFASQHAFVADVPDLQVSLTDGALTAICVIDPTTDPGKRSRQYKLYVTNDIYMLVTNTGAAGCNVGYFGEIIQPGLTRSDIITIGATAYGIVQPPVNESWVITEWGTSTWSAGEINPDCEIGLTDGVLILSRMFQSTMVRGQDKQPAIYINNDAYLNVYSTPGVDFAYTGRRVTPTVISSVTDVVGSATLDITPPVGSEWVITEIGAETWAGAGAPANYPDILVSLMVGANLSDILEAGSVDTAVRWNTECILKIDNTHFLRITEISAGNNEVCVSGFVQREY
jgi:hypothetical protein